MRWVEGGFFAFTVHDGVSVPVAVTDPDLVFGQDSSLRKPQAFLLHGQPDALQSRRDTLSASAFAQLTLSLAPGALAGWDSYFGYVKNWQLVQDYRLRILPQAQYAQQRRTQNAQIIERIGEQFALIAGPRELDPYSRQTFLDNTLRGGQPVVIKGDSRTRVFHTFTRKHGDMERDYNFFELAATYWSQGNGNFRDVNQNRRSENFVYADIDDSNLETFFDLIQLNGNNPLVIQPEKFVLGVPQLLALQQGLPALATPAWQAFLSQSCSPGRLLENLLADPALAPSAGRFLGKSWGWPTRFRRPIPVRVTGLTTGSTTSICWRAIQRSTRTV